MLSDPASLVPLFDVRERVVVIDLSTTLPLLLARSDPQRVALIVSTVSATNVYISTLPDVATDRGVRLNVTALPLWECIFQRHGALCCLAWYCTVDLVPSTLTVIEVLYRPVRTYGGIDA